MSELDELLDQREDSTPERVPNPGWRTCDACGIPKRLCGKNYAKPHGKDYDTICKPCRRKLIQKRKMDLLESNACGSFLKKAGSGGSQLPHISEMLESIMGLMGGSNGFATALLHQYHAAPAGGRIRTQILQLIAKLTERVAESGATRAPASLMSDEELEAAIEERMKTAVLSFKGQQVLGVEADIPDGGRNVDLSGVRSA